jgi:hypothetical protein
MRCDPHRELFFMHNGPGPWPCGICDEPVAYSIGDSRSGGALSIHHRNGDHDDNEPAAEAVTEVDLCVPNGRSELGLCCAKVKPNLPA